MDKEKVMVGTCVNVGNVSVTLKLLTWVEIPQGAKLRFSSHGMWYEKDYKFPPVTIGYGWRVMKVRRGCEDYPAQYFIEQLPWKAREQKRKLSRAKARGRALPVTVQY